MLSRSIISHPSSLRGKNQDQNSREEKRVYIQDMNETSKQSKARRQIGKNQRPSYEIAFSSRPKYRPETLRMTSQEYGNWNMEIIYTKRREREESVRIRQWGMIRLLQKQNNQVTERGSDTTLISSTFLPSH